MDVEVTKEVAKLEVGIAVEETEVELRAEVLVVEDCVGVAVLVELDDEIEVEVDEVAVGEVEDWVDMVELPVKVVELKVDDNVDEDVEVVVGPGVFK